MILTGLSWPNFGHPALLFIKTIFDTICRTTSGSSNLTASWGMSARRFDAIEFWWLSTTKEAACAVRLCLSRDKPEQGAIMAKRKKQSKVQKRGKLPRKVSKSARGKTRTVAKARPKLATGKKAAQKEVAPAVETVEHPALEFEEVRQVSSGPDEM